MSAANVTVIRDFVQAWSRLDVDELVSFFTSDGVWHNMPLEPIAGEDKLRQTIAGTIRNWSDVEWDLTHITSNGDVVMAERVDKMTIDGKAVVLPCAGVFELRDGKIAVWRDYFDLASFSRASGAP